MVRPNLSVMGVIYDALGFAMRHIATALRVAWLPILLLLVLEAVAVKLSLSQPMQNMTMSLRLDTGYTFKLAQNLMSLQWPMVAITGIGVILHAALMVPLIRLASTGVRPSHHTIQFSFGLRQVKYILACLLSFAAIVFAAQFFLGMGTALIQGPLTETMASQQPVFTPGSLHSVETVPVYGMLNGILAQIDGFLLSIGINISTIETMILLPALLVASYFIVRLMPLPFFAAAREPGAGYTSIGRTWALTGGWNIFSMIAILLMLVMIHVFTIALLWLGVQIFGYAVLGSEYLIYGLENFAPDGGAAPYIRGLMVVLFTGIVIAVTTFMAALNAGLGGALVHRALR